MFRLLLAAALFWTAFLAPAAAECLSRGQGRQMMESGRIVPLPDALQRAGLPREGVVDAQLCEGGGGFVYRVRVLQPNGKVRAVNIPAN